MRRAFVIALVLVSLSSAAPALAQRAGGTFNFVAPYSGDLFGLDAHKSTRVQDFLVLMNINRSLYTWDTETNKPKLELATKADVSADGKVWTFKLRDNVKFHNGRKMTADDIIWSYNRIVSRPPSPRRASSFMSSRGPRRSRRARRRASPAEEDRRPHPADRPGEPGGSPLFPPRSRHSHPAQGRGGEEG